MPTSLPTQARESTTRRERRDWGSLASLSSARSSPSILAHGSLSTRCISLRMSESKCSVSRLAKNLHLGCPSLVNVPSNIGEIAGKLMLKIEIPSSFGTRPGDINEKYTTFKSEEWKNWIVMYSLPALYCANLPEEHLEGWGYFVDAVRLMIQNSLDTGDLQLIKVLISKFYRYYTRVLAKLGDIAGVTDEGIKLMTITIHNLLHMPECVTMNGPPCYNWQFFMERFGGLLMGMVNSRSNPLANIEMELNTMTAIDQYNSERQPIGDSDQDQQTLVEDTSNVQSFLIASSMYMFKMKIGLWGLDDAIKGKLVDGYAQFLTEEQWHIHRLLGPELRTEVLRELSMHRRSSVGDAYLIMKRGDLTVEGYEVPKRQGSRLNSRVRIRAFDTLRECFVTRYAIVLRFFKHQFRGKEKHWAYCNVLDDPSQLGDDGEYRRCKITKTIRVSSEIQWTRAFVPVEWIETTVALLQDGDDIFFLDGENHAKYIRQDTSREYA